MITSELLEMSANAETIKHMTDREKLELAAKAVGVTAHHWTDGRTPHECIVLNEGIREHVKLFDPLTDDGDAMRLSVKLALMVRHCPNNTPPDVMVSYRTSENSGLTLTESYGADPAAATRRAIVRAAAEIGSRCK